MRRCGEDREDFTGEDGPLWPMYIRKGGNLYNFCPGKATWDISLKSLFDELVLMSEMKCLPFEGSLYQQPSWVIECLSWFLPMYESMKFYQKVDSILGSDDAKKPAKQVEPTYKARMRR